MKTTNFKLPETKLCIVIWYRNGIKGETLIETPETNVGLVNRMFRERVGASEIRGIKPVGSTSIVNTPFNSIELAFAKA